MQLSTVATTAGLLIASNVFMTFAWYAHLKNLSAKPWWIAALVSWGIALFEYLLQVPANRIGYTELSLPQLKILQEAITLVVFVPFAILYMKQPLKLDYLWASLCIWARCTSSSVDKFRYIVVEGPIGAGKTSLARRLAGAPGAPTCCSSSRARTRSSRASTTTWRATRCRRSCSSCSSARACSSRSPSPTCSAAPRWPTSCSTRTRCSRASRCRPTSSRCTRRSTTRCAPRAPAPDLVIYLQAQPATLVERVRRRGTAYERGISEEYLALLGEGYARFFYHYAAAPVLIVNSENLNFVERDADFELLVSRMRAMRSRREFFNLG